MLGAIKKRLKLLIIFERFYLRPHLTAKVGASNTAEGSVVRTIEDTIGLQPMEVQVLSNNDDASTQIPSGFSRWRFRFSLERRRVHSDTIGLQMEVQFLANCNGSEYQSSREPLVTSFIGLQRQLTKHNT
jgi:hypothetical protein